MPKHPALLPTGPFIIALALVTAGCGAHGSLSPNGPSPRAVMPQGEAMQAEYDDAVEEAASEVSSATQAMMDRGAVAMPAPPPAPESMAAEPMPEPESPITAPDGEAPAIQPATASRAPKSPPVEKQPMLDIEARLQIEVRNVDDSANSLRELLRAEGATLTSENITRHGSNVTASFTFRLPAQKSEVVLPELERLGRVTSRNVAVKDIGKQYFDAQLRLRNLNVTLARYQQLLERANDVAAMLSIERELSRLRGEIEQLSGSLRYMRDRAARATVHVTLLAHDEHPEQIVLPSASFYPGVRGGMVRNLVAGRPGQNLLVGGVSIRGDGRTSLDLEGMRQPNSDRSGLDGFWITIGHDAYSEFLGDGHNRWLNPYLGFRVGYSHLFDRSEALGGVTAGLEIFKTETVSIEADVRFVGLLFQEGVGEHFSIQPMLGANVAF